jgi:hypothetical protein
MIRLTARQSGAQGVATEVVIAATQEQALGYMLKHNLEYVPDMEYYYTAQERPGLTEHQI